MQEVQEERETVGIGDWVGSAEALQRHVGMRWVEESEFGAEMRPPDDGVERKYLARLIPHHVSVRDLR